MTSRLGGERSRPVRLRTGGLSRPATRATLAELGRYLGALALLGVGAGHLQQYFADSYSAIPTIGTLFLLNFGSATLVTLGLLAPVRRLAGRSADAVLAGLALAGIPVAGGSLAGLLVSEHGGLFGFTEQGYRQAIVISIVLELATVALLGLFLALSWLGRPRGGSHRPRRHEA